MQLSRETSDALYQIQAYEEGVIIINGEKYASSLLLMPNTLIAPWGPEDITGLKAEHFESLLVYQPELVLLGTGKTLSFPSPVLFQALTQKQVGVEVMDTKAACRTYTLLASEGRQVVAVLLK
jgi:uncharacterized protein